MQRTHLQPPARLLHCGGRRCSVLSCGYTSPACSPHASSEEVLGSIAGAPERPYVDAAGGGVGMDRGGSQGTRHGLASIAGVANRSCQRFRRQCKVPWLAANQGGRAGKGLPLLAPLNHDLSECLFGRVPRQEAPRCLAEVLNASEVSAVASTHACNEHMEVSDLHGNGKRSATGRGRFCEVCASCLGDLALLDSGASNELSGRKQRRRPVRKST